MQHQSRLPDSADRDLNCSALQPPRDIPTHGPSQAHRLQRVGAQQALGMWSAARCVPGTLGAEGRHQAGVIKPGAWSRASTPGTAV